MSSKPLNEKIEKDQERKMRRLQLEAEERRDKDELKFRKMELEMKNGVKVTIAHAEVKPELVARAKLPKLPPFKDGKTIWIVICSGLNDLPGPVLRRRAINGRQRSAHNRQVRLSKFIRADAVTTDYRQLREAIFRRYDLTEDGYRL